MEKITIVEVKPDELKSFISESVKIGIKEFLETDTKKEQPKTDEFLTRKETATFFRVSLPTIHQWTKVKLLKVYKVGNRSFYKKSDLVHVLTSSNV
jgi:hypothetical protein